MIPTATCIGTYYIVCRNSLYNEQNNFILAYCEVVNFLPFVRPVIFNSFI